MHRPAGWLFGLVGTRIGLGRGRVRGWDSREGGGCGGGPSGSDDHGLGPVLLLLINVIGSYHECVLARKRRPGATADGSPAWAFRIARQPASVVVQRGRVMGCQRGSAQVRRDRQVLGAIVTRVNPEGLKALRMLALERDTTLQAVAIEAFNDVFKKHGKRAVVRNPLLGYWACQPLLWVC